MHQRLEAPPVIVYLCRFSMLRAAVYDCMMRWFGDVMLSIYIYVCSMFTQIYCFQQMGVFAVTVTFDDHAQLSTIQRKPW